MFRGNRRAGRREVVVSEHLGTTAELFSTLGRMRQVDYLAAVARPGSPEARTLRRKAFVPAFGLGLTLITLPLTGRGRAGLTLDGWDLSAGDLELM